MHESGGGGQGLLWVLRVLTMSLASAMIVTGVEGQKTEVHNFLNFDTIKREARDLPEKDGLTSTSEILQEPALDDSLYKSLMSTDTNSEEVATVEDLLHATEDLLDQGHLVLTRSFTEQAHRYNKAVRNMSSVVVIDAPLLSLRLEGDHPSPDWMLHVTGLHLHTDGEHTYLLIGSLRSREQRVVVWSKVTNTVTTLAKFQLTDVSMNKVDKTATHVHDGYLFMVLGSSRSRLVSVVCIQLYTRRVKLPQVITQRGVVGALHLFVASGELYLVVGESYYSSYGDGRGRSQIYVLVGEFFDKQESFLMLGSSGVNDITTFSSQRGTTYILLGMSGSEGSHVYSLDTDTTVPAIKLVQLLEENHVQRLAHFRDKADLRHFVIVLSLGAPSAIYWWDGNQLVKWQEMDTHDVPAVGGSVALLPLPNFEHMLFISAGSNITIYTYHTTGAHHPSFVVSTTCAAIADLSAAVVGRDYMIVYMCDGPVSRVEARLVHLEALVQGMQLSRQETQLSACLDSLRTILDGRKRHVAVLKQIVDTDALMTVDHTQIWTGPITVPEVWVGGTSSLQHTVVIPPGGSLDSNQTRTEYEALVLRLQAELRDLQGAMGSILYYAGTQSIRNPVSGVSVFANTVQFDIVSVHKLHGVPLTSLASEVLLDGLAQTITGHWHMQQLTTQKMTTRTHHPHGSLNGVLTSAFMRRSVASQVVTGRHTYHNLSARHICHTTGCEQARPIWVNGVLTSSIVRRGQDVTFTAKKTFGKVVVLEALEAALINGVSLSRVLSKVVYTDTADTLFLSGTHNMRHLTVHGNLRVESVNGVNIAELDRAVVKKHGDYRLAGLLVYKRNLIVRGSITVQSINGVSWEDLLPLNAPFSISGIFAFARATINVALISDNINGVDLSREAVISNQQQTIQDRIRFLDSVSVTGPAGVPMGDGATINGLDVSELAKGGTLGGGAGRVTVVVEHVMNLSFMQVLGNVVISSINGMALDKLEHQFWRKSLPQEINVPVHIRDAVFMNGFEGTTLNGHQLADYLRLNVNQRITGQYTFEDLVQVGGNLIMTEDKTVGGVLVSSLLSRVVTLNGSQTLEGEVTFSGRVTIFGDVDVGGDFTALQVLSRALRLDETIPHTGHLNFAAGAVVDSLHVTSSDLTVSTLNGMDVAAAAADLVLVDQDATIAGGLRFNRDVNIHELRVSGLVDGVDMARMLSRALRTTSRTTQVVSAALTLEGDVDLGREATLKRVNGEDWAAHLGNVVQVGFRSRIEGRKVFTGGLRVAGNLQPRTINGVQLRALASRIFRKSSQQRISAHYTFIGDVTADDLSALVIDGVTMNEVVLLERGGHVGGRVTFAEDVTLLAGLTADSNVLDSCDFGRIQTGPVIGSGGEPLVDIPAVEINTLVIEGRVFTTTITTHNLDLVHFLRSLVLKSTDQVITAEVKFLNDVRVQRMDAAMVDGVDLQALFRQAVLRSQDVVIECDLHLTEGLQVGRLEVHADVNGLDNAGVLLNGVHLSALQKRAVLRDGRTYVLRGRKVFTAGLRTHHLKAVRLAGIAVQDMVSVSSSSNRLPSHIDFRAPVRVLGDLWVTGLVDGVDLALLFAQRMTVDMQQTLSGTYHFEALKVEGDIITSSINNVTISDLVLRTGLSRQMIIGAKYLAGGLQVNGAIQVSSLNGVNVPDLNRTVVRLDTATVTVRVDTRFEGELRCLAGTEVRQTVNGHDLSVLAMRLAQIKQRLAQERLRITGLLGQFGSLNEDNYLKAREMYAELASLERIFLHDETKSYGTMWTGVLAGVNGEVLKITKCHVTLCGCDIECSYFKLANDTSLTPLKHLGTSVSVMTHSLHSGQYLLQLNSQCVGREMNVKVTLAHHASASVLLQGLLVDSAMFLEESVNYLVAGVYRKDGYADEPVSEVVVIRVDAAAASLHVAGRWVTQGTLVDLDIAYTGVTWVLLLAKGYGVTSVDPYVTTSEILTWDGSARQFRLDEHHLGTHVSNGAFVQVMGETFFVLTQDLPKPPQSRCFAATCSSGVLVYRYNKETYKFEEFQSIPTYGVTAQTTLRVDRSVYLLLTSPTEHSLYVCLYKHSEGFVIISQLFLVSPLSVVSVTAGEVTYILVSTPSGVQRYKVFVKGVNPDSLFLY